ncbi:MAG: hypothetical protein L0I29_00855 [Hyphomicrobiales bacterium]|nr:hypothetical protein [Hyphomicrobiales bacterium]
MTPTSDSPSGGDPRADVSDERPDLLTPVAFAPYAGRDGKGWIEIAGG